MITRKFGILNRILSNAKNPYNGHLTLPRPVVALRSLPKRNYSYYKPSANRVAKPVDLKQKEPEVVPTQLTKRELNALAEDEIQHKPEEAPMVPPQDQPAYLGLDGVLNNDVLIITRRIEWANVLVGFEQANMYEMKNQQGHVVGYMAEEDSLLNTVGRQLLRGHRSFKTTIFDSARNKVLQVHRPVYLISSSLYVNDAADNRIGSVTMDWHLIRRRYKLMHREQPFAYIDSGFLQWEFDLKNADGKSLTAIDKDWTGLGRELFTDGNQYLVKYNAKEEGLPPLELEQKAIALATAISIDHDYFSRRSHSGGFFPPLMFPYGGGSHEGKPADVTSDPVGSAAGGAVVGAADGAASEMGQGGQEFGQGGQEFGQGGQEFGQEQEQGVEQEWTYQEDGQEGGGGSWWDVFSDD
ncbi:hypothetical protein PROFUN_14729 [Planoprotostelium fungivorum]|uniref:Phospholipid scramblase n=1 Tax=Planoprotostelium fungivorum TaxID=1890364 RepID=A0A2P6N256_9EUKA|nr:hypothetical protein PROFUN_14729 [Planoprotostelium fungivorum]